MARGGDAIASGSVVLTTNADGLKAGLSAAESDLHNWGDRVGKAAGGKGGPGGGGLLGSLLGGASALGPVGIAIGAVGAAAGVAAVGLKEASDTLDDIAKQGAMASALGLTAEQFTGIAGVAKSAGEDTREFIESLVTMGKLGTDAANGTEQASQAFKSMGLNAQDFIKLRADEQFFTIFESLKRMDDPLQRTRALMAAFGEDGGKYLLPLLSKSSDELRAMAQGFEISGQKMQKAAAAAEATKGMKASLGKVWQDVAIMAAPFVEKLAKVGTRIIDGLKPALDWVDRYLTTNATIWGAVFDTVGGAVSGVVEWVKSLGAEFGATFGELPSIQDVVIGVWRAIGYAGSYMWDTLKAGAGFFAIGLGAVVEGAGTLVDTFKGAFKDIADMGADAADALGMDETAAKFRKIGGAADRIAASVKGAGADMQKWGTAAVDGFGNSAKQFDKWLDEAVKPKAAGQQAGQEIAKGMAEAIESGPIQLAGALSKGSKEAYSMVVKNNLRGIPTENDPVKGAWAEAKKANKHHAAAGKNLAGIKAKIDALEAV